MFFRIESSNGLAIYEQIVRQVKFAVAGDAENSSGFRWRPQAMQ